MNIHVYQLSKLKMAINADPEYVAKNINRWNQMSFYSNDFDDINNDFIFVSKKFIKLCSRNFEKKMGLNDYSFEMTKNQFLFMIKYRLENFYNPDYKYGCSSDTQHHLMQFLKHVKETKSFDELSDIINEGIGKKSYVILYELLINTIIRYGHESLLINSNTIYYKNETKLKLYIATRRDGYIETNLLLNGNKFIENKTKELEQKIEDLERRNYLLTKQNELYQIEKMELELKKLKMKDSGDEFNLGGLKKKQ